MTTNSEANKPDYQLIGLTDTGAVGNLLARLDVSQGRRRLQALVSEWLRMENLAVLCGAGTSVVAGDEQCSPWRQLS